MRIDDDLQRKIEEIKKNNSNINNGIDLLDIIKAMEQTYNYVNSCVLSDEEHDISDFSRMVAEYNNNCRYKGRNYIPEEYKTVYEIKNIELGAEYDTKFLDIVVYNKGNIKFEKYGKNDEKLEKLIKSITNFEIFSVFSRDAELSFFRDNSELVISKNPYLAIKMEVFNDEVKSVLVVKNNDMTDTLIPQKNSIEYFRVEDIKDYLKGIKIDMDNVPNLAYGFLDEENKYMLNKKIHPELKGKRVKYFDDDTNTFVLGTVRALCGVLATVVLSFFGPAFLVGIAGTLIYMTRFIIDKINFDRVMYDTNGSYMKLYDYLRKAAIKGKINQEKIIGRKNNKEQDNILENRIERNNSFDDTYGSSISACSLEFNEAEEYQKEFEIYSIMAQDNEEKFRMILNKLDSNNFNHIYSVVKYATSDNKNWESFNISLDCREEVIDEVINSLKEKENEMPKKLVKVN